MNLVGCTQVAKQLDVTTNQVYMWNRRRDRNGFPGPAGGRPTRLKVIPLFDLDAVLAWHDQYDPVSGPKPRVRR